MSLTLMLTYPFMQRALIAGTLVSLCAALLGVPLVLKRYSMVYNLGNIMFSGFFYI